MKKFFTFSRKIIPASSLIFIFCMLIPASRLYSQFTVHVTNIDSVTCYGMCNGSIALSATGGTPPYSYQWSNSQTGDTIAGLCAGTYTVTVIKFIKE